ncbi:MAG: aldose epimerase family protein [Gemmataceae bacterium]
MRTLALMMLTVAAVQGSAAVPPGVGPAFEQETFGKLADGKTVVTAYTLINKKGAKATIIDYGGIVTRLTMPDRDGTFADVVLGFDDLKSYLDGHPYFGANVGRCANRIGNAKFTLNGKEYTVTKPGDGPHTLHGGKDGFDKKMWKAEIPVVGPNGVSQTYRYTSKDGEEGYPGQLEVVAQYTLSNDNELKVDFTATTDKTTVCNLAHHSYFNLGGHNSGTVLAHTMTIPATEYTPGDDSFLPTGKIAPVAGTPFDFTKPVAIGDRIKEAGGKPVGYDLNYVVNAKNTNPLTLVATVAEPKSGRVMDVLTTEPGLQFYTGNFLDGTNKGKGGAVYSQYGAFCLEPQKFPDSVNKPEWAERSNPVLKPGEEYRQSTVYRFRAMK